MRTCLDPSGLGCSPFARHYSGNRMTLSLPPGTEMFHFPGFASPAYTFNRRYHAMTRGGLPHSGIFASTPADGSAKLFAICYALHRLRAPRHPPCALTSLATPNKTLFSKNAAAAERAPLSVRYESHTGLEMAGVEPATSCLQSRRSTN